MIKTKLLGVGAASLLVLTACTDPAQFPGTEGQRTQQGALAGAAIGAVLGGTRESGSDRFRNAIVGAAIGAGVGAAVGYSLDQQAAELRSDFGNGDIDIINTGSELIVRMPNALLFPVDSASLAATLRSDLLVLADSLNRYPASVITVVGHTDNSGAASYNLDLSDRRAQAVASVLRSGGVSSGRLSVFGAGEDQPVSSNATADGRAQNRRVEITITPTG